MTMTTIDISETYDYTTNRFETLNVPIEIPLEDRRLSVATLKNAFLFECSLKYRASDTTGSAAGRLFALIVDKNGYYREPDSKWTDKKFVVSYRSAGPVERQPSESINFTDSQIEYLKNRLFFMPSKQSALKTPQETPVNSSDDSIEAGIAREEKNPNYIDGGCVTPISDSVAVTYKHGHHKYLEIYDEKNDNERSLVCIRQVEDPDVKHDMKVVYISKKEDFILLRSLNDEPVFTTYTPIGFPRESQLFMITGLSHSTPKDGHHITWRRGILCSEKLDYKRRLLGTALIGDRDSGAPCYKSPCSLIGIMSSTKTTAPHLEDKQAKYLFRLIENAINDASCHPSECTIVPATYISSALQEYLIGTGEIEKPSEKYRQEVVGQPLPFHDKPSSDVQDAPPSKRPKLEPEEQWLQKVSGIVNVNVVTPTTEDWSLQGRSVKFTIEVTSTVADLKAVVQKKTSVPMSEFKLFYNKRLMEDANTLAYYNFVNNTEVRLRLNA